MKKNTKIVFAVIFFITFMLIGYTALKKTPFPKKYTRNQYGDVIKFDENIEFEQVFVSKIDFLDSISIKRDELANNLEKGKMSFEIYNSDKELIYQNNYEYKDINDYQIIRLRFDIQEHVKGKEYTLKVKLSDFDKNNNISIYSDAEGNEFVSKGDTNITGSIAVGQHGQDSGYFYSVFFLAVFVLELLIFMLIHYKNKEVIIKHKKLNTVLTVIESLVFSLSSLDLVTTYMLDGRIKYMCLPIIGILFILLARNLIINLYYGKIEDIFLALVIPIGTLYFITLVPGMIPDEPYHYNQIFQLLEGNIFKKPCAIYEIPIYDNYLNARKALFDPAFEPLHFKYYATIVYSYLLYIPASLGVFVGRILNFTTLGTLYVGSYFNFILFIFVGYNIIKLLPFCKKAAFVYLMNPMLLHQVTSLSCDALIITSCLLFITYILYIKYEKKNMEL